MVTKMKTEIVEKPTKLDLSSFTVGNSRRLFFTEMWQIYILFV